MAHTKARLRRKATRGGRACIYKEAFSGDTRGQKWQLLHTVPAATRVRSVLRARAESCQASLESFKHLPWARRHVPNHEAYSGGSHDTPSFPDRK